METKGDDEEEEEGEVEGAAALASGQDRITWDSRNERRGPSSERSSRP